MTYSETLDYLFNQLPAYQIKGAKAYKANLDNIYALSKLLGQPEKQFKSIHVAGTNGKGSCSHLMASVLQESNYKTGLYTSPHLKDFRERIKVNGQMISEQEVIDFVQRYKEEFEQIGLSFFEWTVGLAFYYFAQQKVDMVVIEVGLGGRLDATNIIQPEVCLITNIGMDHTFFLGDTLAAIAGEKAGIIKKNTPVVIGETTPETYPVFETIAQQKEAPAYFINHTNTSPLPSMDLKGDYQQKNGQTVLKALHLLQEKGWNITPQNISSGFGKVIENTGLLGRWQILQQSPLTIADTAHNKEGLSLTMKQLQNTPHQELHIVFGMVNDKDPEQIVQLLPAHAQYYLCAPQIARALPPDDLKKHFHDLGYQYSLHTSVSSAFKQAQLNAQNEDVIYAGGSTFVVAEIL